MTVFAAVTSAKSKSNEPPVPFEASAYIQTCMRIALQRVSSTTSCVHLADIGNMDEVGVSCDGARWMCVDFFLLLIADRCDFGEKKVNPSLSAYNGRHKRTNNASLDRDM